VKYFGITKMKYIRSPYHAQIKMDVKKKHIGYYSNAEAAPRARTTRSRAHVAAASSTFPTQAARQQQHSNSNLRLHLHHERVLLLPLAPSEQSGK
jgi:hypothetical protein